MRIFLNRLICLTALIGNCLAVLDLAAVIRDTPSCATVCTVQILGQSNCPVTEITSCVCNNTALQKTLAQCILKSCDIPDQRKASIIFQDTVCEGIDQESRWPEIKSTVIILAAITYPITILRFVSRFFIARRLWWDDWCILATMLFLIPLTILPFLYANQGFGRHFWDVRPKRLNALRKTFYATQIFYVTVLVLSKCSLLFLYLRIFINRPFRRFVKCCIVFLLVHGLSFVISIIFQCVPIRAIWTLEPAKCINLQAVICAGAGITIFEDFFIMFIPILELRKLEFTPRKKLALAFMFAVGSFASITSIIRLRYITKFSNSIDVTWDNVDVVLWSDIEMSTGVICASLICIRPLFSHLVPSFIRNKDVVETIPSSQNSSKFSQRFSALFIQQKVHNSRHSGHIKINESSPPQNLDLNAKEASHVWVQNETKVDSRSIQLEDLNKSEDNLSPDFRAQTIVEVGTRPSTGSSSKLEEVRRQSVDNDPERG